MGSCSRFRSTCSESRFSMRITFLKYREGACESKQSSVSSTVSLSCPRSPPFMWATIPESVYANISVGVTGSAARREGEEGGRDQEEEEEEEEEEEGDDEEEKDEEQDEEKQAPPKIG